MKHTKKSMEDILSIVGRPQDKAPSPLDNPPPAKSVKDRQTLVKEGYDRQDEETAALLSSLVGGQTANQTANQNPDLANQQTPPTNQSASRLGYPNGQANLDSHLASQITPQTSKRSRNRKRMSHYLTSNERIFWTYLQQFDELRAPTQKISDALGISVDSLRKIIYRFRDLEFISVDLYRQGFHQGLVIKKLIELDLGSQKLPPILPVNLATQNPPLEVKFRKKELSYYEKVEKISDDEIWDLYPHLATIGFSTFQIQQCIQYWKEHDIVPRGFHQSLRHADFAVEKGLNGGIFDKNGKPIESLLDWVFKSLQMKGCFFPPKGYKDPTLLIEKEEKASLANQEILKKKAEEESRKETLRKERDRLYAQWRKGLTATEESELLAKFKKNEFFKKCSSDEEKFRWHWLSQNPEPE